MKEFVQTLKKIETELEKIELTDDVKTVRTKIKSCVRSISALKKAMEVQTKNITSSNASRDFHDKYVAFEKMYDSLRDTLLKYHWDKAQF